MAAKTENKNEIVKTGRRKCSIAVAKVVSGKGRVFVNGNTLKGYFGNRPSLEMEIYNPLVLTENQDKFDIANQAIDATYKFFESINMPMRLKDVGIDDSRIDEMAHHIAVNEGLENAWIPLYEEDIAKILTESL